MRHIYSCAKKFVNLLELSEFLHEWLLNCDLIFISHSNKYRQSNLTQPHNHIHTCTHKHHIYSAISILNRWFKQYQLFLVTSAFYLAVNWFCLILSLSSITLFQLIYIIYKQPVLDHIAEFQNEKETDIDWFIHLEFLLFPCVVKGKCILYFLLEDCNKQQQQKKRLLKLFTNFHIKIVQLSNRIRNCKVQNHVKVSKNMLIRYEV